MKQVLNKIAGWLVLYFLPGGFKLGFGWFATWYETNGYHRFKKGDVIKLKSRACCGFGARPVGKVLEVKTGERKEEVYVMEMETDENKDYFAWFKTGKVSENTRRVTQIEVHFKWNIEHMFELASPENFTAYIAA